MAKRSQWPRFLAATAAIVVVAVAIWVIIQPSDTLVSSQRLSPITGGSSDINTEVTAPPPAITFASMRDFVNDYYARLPADPSTAWTDLDPTYQQRTGLEDYRSFWGGIRSVTVMSVSPRDAASVIVRLQYVTATGQSDTEDRWLAVGVEHGVMRITDSGRIGSA